MAVNRSRRSRSAEELHRHKRMARTLGCLVASMTVGAALLDWIQPERMPIASARTELMSEVRDVLGQGGGEGGPARQWEAVHVSPLRPDDRDQDRWHFVIGRDGQLSLISPGRMREGADSHGEVRVGLLGSTQSNEITPGQWARALQLVQTLQQEYQIPGERVVWDDTLVVPMASPAPPAAPVGAHPSTRSGSRQGCHPRPPPLRSQDSTCRRIWPICSGVGSRSARWLTADLGETYNTPVGVPISPRR